MRRIPVQTYILVFFITVAIVMSAFYASLYINNKKTGEIKTDENKIAIDIFTLEAKIDLLKETECRSFNVSSLKSELTDLSARIDFMEHQMGQKDPTIFRLKRYYALLEIKSYIINQKIAKQCDERIPTVIYLYELGANCDTCTEESYVLDALQTKRSDVIFYNLDFNYDMAALKAYTSLGLFPAKPPILIINGTIYGKFLSVGDVEKILDTQKLK